MTQIDDNNFIEFDGSDFVVDFRQLPLSKKCFFPSPIQNTAVIER